MLEFTKLKQNAINLYKKLTVSSCNTMGCFSFFSAYMPTKAVSQDAWTIGMVARSLHEDYDQGLVNFTKTFASEPIVTVEELSEFKRKVLIGIYLLIWSQYNSLTSNLMYQPLIHSIEQALDVRTLQDVDDELLNSSLTALSQYSSYIYEHRSEQLLFTDLNKRLGTTIQVDIETARHMKMQNASSWFEKYSGMFCALGINKMS